MPEREFGWEYDDWQRDTGGDPTAAPKPGLPPAPTTTPGWTDPDNAPPTWLHDPNAAPPPPTEPGVYWAWNGTMWELRNSPRPPGRPQVGPTADAPVDSPIPTTLGGIPTGDGGFGGGGGGGAWPSYNAPSWLDPGAFDSGPSFTFAEFSHPAFQKPSADSMLQEPGFQFRMDQGRKALEASAAGKGTLRSGGTLKDILSFGQNFASQEYGNVYNRALNEYDTNRNNAFGNWNANRSNALDIWSNQYGQRRDVYDRHAQNVFGQNTFNQGNALNDFNGRQRQSEMDMQDAFNRWAKQGDWLSQYD